jgi:hypothetical protein
MEKKHLKKRLKDPTIESIEIVKMQIALKGIVRQCEDLSAFLFTVLEKERK